MGSRTDTRGTPEGLNPANRVVRLDLPESTYRLRLDPQAPVRELADHRPLPDSNDAPLPKGAGLLITPAGRLGALGALRALSTGAERFHIEYVPGETFQVNRRGLIAVALGADLRSVAGSLPWLQRAWLASTGSPFVPGMPTLASIRRALRVVREEAPPPQAGSGVVHWLSSLGPGGAERTVLQLVESRGERPAPEIWVERPLVGAEAHYRPALESAGARVTHVSEPRAGRLTAPWRAVNALGLHPQGRQILQLARALAWRRPQVLHCWLDASNATGALAGLLAGVPNIVLSTLNVNPSHFPRFHRPWFRDTYQLLAPETRIVLTAMTETCARDYATWAGLEPERFEVVGHGLDLERWSPLEPSAREEERDRLGIPRSAFVVSGVFRLDPEKRPLDFVRVLAKASQRLPHLFALHLGDGPSREAFKEAIAAAGLSERIRVLGVVEDPRPIVGCADVSLLTSEVEGLGIVALEAQALGLPVVATRAGGLVEAVPGERLLHEVGDVEALADTLVELAQSRHDHAQAGQRFVAERFGMRAFVERVERLYAN